jgi:hypothetical protein
MEQSFHESEKLLNGGSAEAHGSGGPMTRRRADDHELPKMEGESTWTVMRSIRASGRGRRGRGRMSVVSSTGGPFAACSGV